MPARQIIDGCLQSTLVHSVPAYSVRGRGHSHNRSHKRLRIVERAGRHSTQETLLAQSMRGRGVEAHKNTEVKVWVLVGTLLTAMGTRSWLNDRGES